MNFDEDQLDALRVIVGQWIHEGFTVPPYRDAVYDIFEALGLDPQDFQYDIRRDRGTTEEP